MNKSAKYFLALTCLMIIAMAVYVIVESTNIITDTWFGFIGIAAGWALGQTLSIK